MYVIAALLFFGLAGLIKRATPQSGESAR
jgi:hypothetical protein